MIEDEDSFDSADVYEECGSPLIDPSNMSCYTEQQEALEGENFCKFRGFVGICKSFHHKICGRGNFWRHQRAICESFLHENFFCPLYLISYKANFWGFSWSSTLIGL